MQHCACVIEGVAQRCNYVIIRRKMGGICGRGQKGVVARVGRLYAAGEVLCYMCSRHWNVTVCDLHIYMSGNHHWPEVGSV